MMTRKARRGPAGWVGCEQQVWRPNEISPASLRHTGLRGPRCGWTGRGRLHHRAHERRPPKRRDDDAVMQTRFRATSRISLVRAYRAEACRLADSATCARPADPILEQGDKSPGAVWDRARGDEVDARSRRRRRPAVMFPTPVRLGHRRSVGPLRRAHIIEMARLKPSLAHLLQAGTFHLDLREMGTACARATAFLIDPTASM